MHRVRAADVCRRSLGKPEVPDFAFRHEPSHGADCLLDRILAIDSMQVIEINHVRGEPAKAGVASRADVCGISVAPGHFPLIVAYEPEFRGKNGFFAQTGKRRAKEAFVVPGTIGIRGVKEIAAEFQCAMNRGNGLGIACGAIGMRHSEAPQPQWADLRPVRS